MKKLLPYLPRIAAYSAAGIGVVLLAGGGFASWLALSNNGHKTASDLVGYFTDGEVQIDQLSGNLLHTISARQIRIADDKGVYLIIDQPKLTWHALSLIRDRVRIDDLQARRIRLSRAPLSDSDSSGDGPQIRIQQLHIGRIDVAKAAYGQGAHLTLAGKLHYIDGKNLAADLTARQIGGHGSYRVALRLKSGWPEGFVRVDENGAGFLGALAGMPDLGAVHLTLDAHARGPKDAVQLHFSAGALKLVAAGQVDLAEKQFRVRFSADSPAMAPRKDLSWQKLKAEGSAHGNFRHPVVEAALSLNQLKSGTSAIARTVLNLSSKDQHVRLKGEIAGLSLPGDEDKALAGAPIRIAADLALGKKAQPLTFTISHPLMHISGEGLMQQQRIRAKLYLPRLKPLAKLAGAELTGKAHLNLVFSRDEAGETARLSGYMAATGKSLTDRMIGKHAEISAKYETVGSTEHLTADLSSAVLTGHIHGSGKPEDVAYKAAVTLKDAAVLSPELAGSASFNATYAGPPDTAKLKLHGRGQIGAKGAKADRMQLNLTAAHLSGPLNADLQLSGVFSDSPLTLNARIGQSKTGMRLTITDAVWRSARLFGTLTQSKSGPGGDLNLQIAKLSDLSAFAGMKLAGALNMQATTTASGDVRFASHLQNLRAGENAVKNVSLNGIWQRGLKRLHAKVQADKIHAAGVKGNLSAEIYGPLDDIAAAMKAHLTTPGGVVDMTTQLQLDPNQPDLQISTLNAKWNGKKIALAEAAEIRQIDSGLLTRLILTDHDRTRLSVSGTIPQKPGQSFALTVKGQADMNKWADALTAQGRTLHGLATLDFHVAGTTDAPDITGQAKLTKGRFYDVASGLRLHAIHASLLASGDQIRLKNFSADAHHGHITGSGSITTSGAFPVDLSFHAKDARPFTRDGFEISLDGDVRLKGALMGNLAVDGKLKLDKGEIRLPDKMPPSIAVLDVRHPGTKSEPQTKSNSRIAIAMEITSPGQFFIRGHGLEAELAGTIRIAGTSAKPELHGKLDMRHGTYSMAGTSMNFTSGSINFEGSNSSGEIDPALDFTAESQTSSVTATLKITGTAKQPKITLSSSPSMPQDEILSQLLFQQSMDSLSPLQLAQIAQALVSLSGLDGGINPVEIARSSLKLDRLSVSSGSDTDSDTSNATIEAGKYVLHNVYVGAKQSFSGGTRAQVQVDINRHFKIEGSIATDSGSSAVPTTETQDTGDTVGLSYQFEY